MSKKKHRIDDKQLNLFDYIKNLSEQLTPTEGQFRIIDQLRSSLRKAIKDTPLSIHQIAGEMSHLLGESISSDQIYSWTRSSDELNGRPGRHIPAEYLPAFCQVTQCSEPIALLGNRIGLFVMPGPEVLRAEIQKLEEEIKNRQARKKERLMFLKHTEKGSP